jgi:hypothetical protein
MIFLQKLAQRLVQVFKKPQSDQDLLEHSLTDTMLAETDILPDSLLNKHKFSEINTKFEIVNKNITFINHTLNDFESKLKTLERRLTESSRPDLGRLVAPSRPVVPIPASGPGSGEILETVMNFADGFFRWLDKADGRDPQVQDLATRFNSLMQVFELRIIAHKGDTYNPELHQIHGFGHDGLQADQAILEVFSPGFKYKNEVIRYASVTVNRQGADRGLSEESLALGATIGPLLKSSADLWEIWLKNGGPKPAPVVQIGPPPALDQGEDAAPGVSSTPQPSFGSPPIDDKL